MSDSQASGSGEGGIPEIAAVDRSRLRRRRSAKWTYFEADVLPAWVAEMDFPLAPPISAALRDAIDLGDVGYANPGATDLAAELSGFAGRRFGWEIDPASVITCNDVVGGLRDLLRTMLDPGDGVIVNPPVYHPFFSLIPEAGCRVVEVPLGESGRLDLDGIEAAMAAGARAILLCNPHNPTGSVATASELRALASLAAAHGAWVFADEIHAPLAHAGAEHVPFVTVSAEAAERGIALVSASKAFNLAGLGCAQIVTAGEGAAAAVGELPEGMRHSGHLGVIAAEAAYRDGDEWLDAVRAVLDRNRRELSVLLADRVPGARYEIPAAGYLAWIDLSGTGLGPDPAPAILDRGRLAVSPGLQFGRGGEGHVRLNFGTSPELMAEAVDRIAAAVGSASG